jgi:imidazole glycerol-phosphate synthase subunit HisF
MFRPRIIPVLLVRQGGLVKSEKFRRHRYIGDPINAVRIFNDLKADEIVLLDIDATREGRRISADLVNDVGEEAFMPFAVGGGVRTLDDIGALVEAGAEKIVIGTAAGLNARFVREAADTFGTSTIAVCIDYREGWFGRAGVFVRNGSLRIRSEPVEFAKMIEDQGAGEIIVQCIDRDGTYSGYDVKMVRSMSSSIAIPVVALGGASGPEDLRDVVNYANASAAAAGSLFVYKGMNQGVLINYPGEKTLCK